MLHFDEHSNQNIIQLHVGEEFVIILRENPTTGFSWNPISSGEPACKLLDQSFDSAGNTPGKGGSHSWHFQAVKEGMGKIEFAYRRAWEQDRPPAQSFTLGINVRK
ncbi:MAG TPA: protease inhibitor I42 family protein [Ktedonobacteraceae bacterium]|nr:protease inhibitor I42 family protein [Ktedonobacteraceae bacterium]